MIGFNEIAATFSGFYRSIAELVQRFVTIRLPLADTLATSALFNSIIDLQQITPDTSTQAEKPASKKKRGMV